MTYDSVFYEWLDEKGHRFALREVDHVLLERGEDAMGNEIWVLAMDLGSVVHNQLVRLILASRGEEEERGRTLRQQHQSEEGPVLRAVAVMCDEIAEAGECDASTAPVYEAFCAATPEQRERWKGEG